MTHWVKQSTAATILVGPAVDNADAVTPETGLGAGTVDEIGVYKHDATALTDISGTTTMTHRAGGMYTVTLSTSDTGTLGRMTFYLRDDDVCLPIWKEFMVLPANVYDSLVGGTDSLEVDAVAISGDTTAADNLETATDGGSYNIGGGAVVAASVSAGVTLADDAITSAKYDESTAFPVTAADTGATQIARVGADGDTLETLSDQIDGVTTATAADIADAVWDEATAGHVGAGSFGAAVGDILDDTGTSGVVLADDAITASKYDETTAFPVASADSGATQIARVGADGDTLETLSDQIDAVSTATAADVADAVWDEARADHVGAGSFGQYVLADAIAISGDTTAADNAELMFDGTGYAGGTTKLQVNTTLIEGTDATNQIRDAVVDDATRIDATALNTLSSHDPGSTIAAQTDITGLNDPTAAAIADAVWDEARAGHVAGGSFGETMGTLESNIDYLDVSVASRSNHSAAQAADAVWEELRAGHGTAGSYGETMITLEANIDYLDSAVSAVKTDTAAILDDTGTSGVLLAAAQGPVEFTGQVKITADASSEGALHITNSGTDGTGLHAQGLLTGAYYYSTAATGYGLLLQASNTNGTGLAINNAQYRLDTNAVAQIADAIWDEAKAGHVAAGSFGEEVQAHSLSTEISALNDPTAAAVADAVWDELIAGHAVVGSTGESLTTAATAGDVWDVALPGAYVSGDAGYILGNIGALDFSTVTSTVTANNSGELTFTKYVTFSETLSSLTIPANWTACLFTLKRDENIQADSASDIQIRATNGGDAGDGLIYIDQDTPTNKSLTAADASLTVDQAAGTIVVTVSDNATAVLNRASGLTYDIKAICDDGTTDHVAMDTAHIIAAVTRALS